ncbi:hypothetical protein BWD42_00055 [Sphingobacterium sp. CZ-UAM]|uniref:hypothetical protein n=1 Tax=Sphingobacterium sp. CZ-UAM TaxID=1933868 RepID=UPI0009875FFE|nr:hypothetical protein [Sphingobacterium sp. CZ-UAM]OOG18427.1 hypothetical protein BWD42_00055 [Sphingobacterium sp. CZ-UAM]
MGTKEEIFNKIGDLLQDLNAQYLVLSEKSGVAEIAELVSLEAKAQSVAAYITLLKTDAVLADRQVQNPLRDSVMDSKKIAFNDYFTPPSSLRTSSPVIVEQEPLEKEVARNDEPIKNEPVKSEEEYIASANIESEESDDLPTTPYSSTTVSESRPATHENVVEHIEENHYKSDEPKIDLIDEAPVIVTSVVEEPKEIIIEETQESFIQEEINTVVEETPSRPLTLNEIISQQKQAGVQNRVYQVNQSGSSDKLTDIKTGISLNDKLLFIKDLFNGYSLAYSEAVELLNRFSTYAEADAFLQTNYAVKNRWADKPHTVEKLYEVLRRRYS